MKFESLRRRIVANIERHEKTLKELRQQLAELEEAEKAASPPKR